MAGLFQQLFGNAGTASQSATSVAPTAGASADPVAGDGGVAGAAQGGQSAATQTVSGSEQVAVGPKSPLDTYLPIWNTTATSQEESHLLPADLPLD